jgi:hypothetical protein
MSIPSEKAAVHVHDAAALMRTRATAALLLVLGAILFQRFSPAAATFPEVGLLVAGGLLALALARGAVSRDLADGSVLLWIQKPGRLVGFYAGRLVTVVLLTWMVHLAGGLIFLVAGAGPPRVDAGLVASLALVDVSVASAAFAVSAVRAPLESLLAAGLLLYPGLMGADAVTDPEAFGVWAPWVAAQRFPVLEIQALRRWIEGGGTLPTTGAFLRLALYPLAWAALGLALVAWRERGLTTGSSWD